MFNGQPNDSGEAVANSDNQTSYGSEIFPDVEHFFFQTNDPRLEFGATKFSQTLSAEELEARWANVKKDLSSDYRSRVAQFTKLYRQKQQRLEARQERLVHQQKRRVVIDKKMLSAPRQKGRDRKRSGHSSHK